LLRREPRIAPWSTATTPAPAGIDPCTSELLPEPATPVTTTNRDQVSDLQQDPGAGRRLQEEVHAQFGRRAQVQDDVEDGEDEEVLLLRYVGGALHR
jgi:hypothetical protein